MISEYEKGFFKRQFKILPIQPLHWTLEQVIRLLVLLKVKEPLHSVVYVDKLISNQIMNIQFFEERFEGKVTQPTFFPLQKLKAAISYICKNQPEQASDMDQSQIFQEIGSDIELSDELVLKSRQFVDKLVQTEIIQLSTLQLFNFFKANEQEKIADMIKRFNIDGFALICTISDSSIRRQIKNWFNDTQIQILQALNILFVGHHFRQQNQLKNLELNQKKTTQEDMSKSKTTEMSQSNHSQEAEELVIMTYENVKKMSEDEIQIANDEELGESIIMGTSEIMDSQLGQSQMGHSEMGYSEYAQSMRGSVYLANSEYDFPSRESVDCRMSFNVIRTSFLYDDEILNTMKSECMNLPFDLFNFEPLNQIKIHNTSTENKHQIFSVEGARFGRDKSNDLSFPDELSISSKHARILFKNEAFYLQDVGSKTGTFLRIIKVIKIEEYTYIQLSYEIELIIKIIKTNKKDGVLKVQVVRPENYPDYKISLREGYKVEIGRSEKCHIRLNNQTVAQKHAQIYYKDGSFMIKSYHSKYPIWRRLSKKSEKSAQFKLKKGDVFRLSSKKTFVVEAIINQLSKSAIEQ